MTMRGLFLDQTINAGQATGDGLDNGTFSIRPCWDNGSQMETMAWRVTWVGGGLFQRTEIGIRPKINWHVKAIVESSQFWTKQRSVFVQKLTHLCWKFKAKSVWWTTIAILVRIYSLAAISAFFQSLSFRNVSILLGRFRQSSVCLSASQQFCNDRNASLSLFHTPTLSIVFSLSTWVRHRFVFLNFW